jgi:hypothetical protein
MSQLDLKIKEVLKADRVWPSQSHAIKDFLEACTEADFKELKALSIKYNKEVCQAWSEAIEACTEPSLTSYDRHLHIEPQRVSLDDVPKVLGLKVDLDIIDEPIKEPTNMLTGEYPIRPSFDKSFTVTLKPNSK